MSTLIQCPCLSNDIDKILKNRNNRPKYFIVSYLHMSLPLNLLTFSLSYLFKENVLILITQTLLCLIVSKNFQSVQLNATPC